MNKKTILKVKTLGRFSILNGKNEFPHEKKRSAQVELLIIYLIIERNGTITNQQLIEFLWPNGNADKPEGALRNLIYRARKELKLFVDGEDCIKSKGRSYFWNSDIECKVDIEEIERLIKRIITDQDVERKFERTMDLLNKYHSDFLPEYSSNKWVNEINNCIKDSCLKALLSTLDLLAKNEDYEGILQICNHPNCQDIIDTRVYEAKLYAYYKMGQNDLALSFYRKLVDYYYSKYGIGVSRRLKEIYQMILDTAPATQIGVDELEDTLMAEKDTNCTYYCDFDVFKNIYQINIRSAKRSMKPRILALLTLKDESNKLDEKVLHNEADYLRNIIAESLRKNDVFSKFNMSQYALIISSPDNNGARIAVERIIERYNSRKHYECLSISFEFKKIH